MTPGDIFASLAKLALPGDPRLSWADLVEQVEHETGVRWTAMLSRRRLKSIAAARCYLYALLHHGARYSCPEIGTALQRHHATVLAGVRSAEKERPWLLDLPHDAALSSGFAGMGAGAGI